MKPIDFNLSTIPGEDLAGLIQWCGNRLAEPFAFWLGCLLAEEAVQREDAGKGGREIVAFSLPHDWTDAQLASALESVTLLSVSESPNGIAEATGQLLDTLLVHVVGPAAGRLRDRHSAATN